MGYLKDQLIEKIDKGEETILNLPEILAKANRKTSELRQKLDSLKTDYKKEISTFQKYKGYIISRIIGGIVGALIAKLF